MNTAMISYQYQANQGHREEGSRVAVSLEGLSREQIDVFPAGSFFYASRAMALAAVGDVSDSPRWLVRTSKGSQNSP